jgi:glycosyltransferase involved in cell wall biosynthesis
MYVGIDIEQFVRDPYASGIQRVLQYLAREWPSEEVQADFVVPMGDRFGLLTPDQAADLISIAFAPRSAEDDLRQLVAAGLDEMAPLLVKPGDLLAIYDAWLLPEVSYLPSVLERFELFSRCVPTAMIGYDTLPMSDPANYRFRPGTSAWVSEYFRHLATADTVICISAYARDSILGRLRRDPVLAISVAHPGGDHLAVRDGLPPARPVFARLGTLEARKHPVEILESFQHAVAATGLDAELLFIGNRSASDEAINRAIRTAREGVDTVRWIEGASDAEVYNLVQRSSAFLSIGVEGYGIPVLEAIRLGTPVLFDGIQPAGELMFGRGARRIDGMSIDGLAGAFAEFGATESLAGLRAELDPVAVPTWRAFAEAVAQSIMSAR